MRMDLTSLPVSAYLRVCVHIDGEINDQIMLLVRSHSDAGLHNKSLLLLQSAPLWRPPLRASSTTTTLPAL